MRKVLLAILLALGAPGCGKKEAAQSQPPAQIQRHSTTGVIKAVKNQGRILVIDHQEFPGFMEAMTMAFEVQDPKLAEGLREGDRVAFTISNVSEVWPIVEIKKLAP